MTPRVERFESLHSPATKADALTPVAAPFLNSMGAAGEEPACEGPDQQWVQPPLKMTKVVMQGKRWSK